MSLPSKLRLVLKRARENGLRYTFEKAVLNGFLRPMRAKANFRRYRDGYPTNLIFIAGLGKGGSTWFARMFASLPGFEVLTPLRWKVAHAEQWDDFDSTNLFPGVFDEFKEALAVVKHHTWGFPENAGILRELGMKYIVTVRDPRDALISNYHYAKNHHENWDHHNAAGIPIETYISRKLESGDFNRQFLDWCRSWNKHRDPEKSIMIRYEDALTDAFAVMRRGFDFLGFEVPDAEVRRIVDANSFENYAGRKQGEESTTSFFRKGVSGEWRAIFSPDNKAAFAQQGEDVINAFGYEPTLDG